MGVGRRLGPSGSRGGNGVEAGIFPRVRFWWFSQNRPPTRVSRTLQNRGLDLHQDGGIAEKTSFRRKNLGRRMRSLYRGCCRPTGLTGPWHRSDRSNQPVRPVQRTGLTGPAGINTPSLVLGLVRLLYCVREFSVSPGRRPYVPLPQFISLG